MEKDLVLNINITDSWMSYHFKTTRDKWNYHKLIYKFVKNSYRHYWNNYSFLTHITIKTIDHLARMDALPLSPIYIMIALREAFYNHCIDFLMLYAK